MGKREAQCANQLTSEQAAEIAKEVAEKCSNLDFDPEVGMTHRDVDLSFEVSDGEWEKRVETSGCYLIEFSLWRMCVI